MTEAPAQQDIIVPPEEVAAYEEAQVNALAVANLRAFIDSDTPLRLADDTYLGIVATARRYNEGNGTEQAVQAECDRVFGAGKVDAGDLTTQPPEVEPPARSSKK